MNGVLEKFMEPIPILFAQTLESLRRIGARGGKACARNRRAHRMAAEQASVTSLPVIVVPIETTAQAIARLDDQFPWLRSGQRRGGTRVQAIQK